MTCKDALEDLPDAEAFAELREGDAVVTSDFGEPSKYAAGLRGIGNDAWAFGHPRNWEPAELTSSARTEHTDISRRRAIADLPTQIGDGTGRGRSVILSSRLWRRPSLDKSSRL